MRYASITRRLEGLGADKWALHFAALGESFGAAGAGHIRISLTAPLEVLEAAVAAMVSFAARQAASPAS